MIFCSAKISSIAGLLLCLWGSNAVAQSTQVLLSPTGNGGFEDGADFAANGWTAVDFGNTNKWIVGTGSTPSAGNNAAYISNNNNSYAYTNFGSANISRVMFWRDIVFPAGYNTVTLSFKIKVEGQDKRDDLSVFFQNGNTVPPVTQPNESSLSAPSIANTTRLATLSLLGTQYVTKTYTLNAGNATASTTRRLIFYWENNGLSGTQPPASIDEISLTAVSSCTPPVLTSYADNYNCGPGAVTLSASTVPGATVNWYSSATGNTVLATGNTFTTPVLTATASYYVTARQGNCESSSPRQIVTATVRSLPEVNIGNDIDFCAKPGDSVLLDAGSLPDNPTFLWNDGQTGASRYVHQSGTYIVTATDQYGCKDADTVLVNFKQIPVVSLGNDTNVCIGGSLVLHAQNPNAAYLWNTGSMAQQITIQSPGSFSVKVTNAAGCSATDTIVVTMNGQLPVIDGIIIRNDALHTFSFIADNPRHVTTYEWDFGDGSTPSNEASPVHIYAGPGAYMVTLRLQSSCGSAVFTQLAAVVGIKETAIKKDALLITPNPAHGDVSIINKGAFKIKYIEVYDVTGKVIYKEETDSAIHHHLETAYLPAGTYLIKIITDKGIVTRKLQLLK